MASEPPSVAPQIVLPATFRISAADPNLGPSKPAGRRLEPDPSTGLEGMEDGHASVEELGIGVSLLKGDFSGPGFNMIFRPHGTQIKKPGTGENLGDVNAGGFNNEVLELNLTHENWSFTNVDLGDIPNRGLRIAGQDDVFLHGVPYLQTVKDVTGNGKRIPVTKDGVATDPSAGTPRDIHFEPGFFLNVPTTKNPAVGNFTIARLASIPHGTTINAQGAAPALIPAPDITIDKTFTQPIGIFDKSKKNFFPQLQLNGSGSNTVDKLTRLPQKLDDFNTNGEITQAILDDPRQVLLNHNRNKTFQQTVKFSVSTKALPNQATPEKLAIAAFEEELEKLKTSTDTIAQDAVVRIQTKINNFKATEASGTANIAFLDGGIGAARGPTSQAAEVTADFWLSTVKFKLQVPDWNPANSKDAQGRVTPLRITPTTAPDGTKYVEGTVPTFVFPTDKPIKKQEVTVDSLQFQYAQNVFLNFNTLTWMHVSVATAVPKADVSVDPRRFRA
jgi:hypothetical protein